VEALASLLSSLLTYADTLNELLHLNYVELLRGFVLILVQHEKKRCRSCNPMFACYGCNTISRIKRQGKNLIVISPVLKERGH